MNTPDFNKMSRLRERITNLGAYGSAACLEPSSLEAAIKDSLGQNIEDRKEKVKEDALKLANGGKLTTGQNAREVRGGQNEAIQKTGAGLKLTECNDTDLGEVQTSVCRYGLQSLPVAVGAGAFMYVTGFPALAKLIYR